MAEPKGVLVKDLEAKVNTLERSNFDLKMQIYYLNEKINAPPGSSSNGSGISEDTQLDSRAKAVAEDSKSELVALQEQARRQAKRITELELELIQQRSQSSKAALGQGASSAENAAHLEENRRRERSAMQAIAEHDAAMIAQLQETLTLLEQQHAGDQALTSQCADKISRLVAELAVKDQALAAQAESVQRLQVQVDSLDIRVKQQDMMLLQKSIAAGVAAAQRGHGQSEAKELASFSSPSRRWIQEVGSGSGGTGIGAGAGPGLAAGGTEVAPPTGGLSTTRDFLDFGVQGAWEELAALRAANKDLSEELEKRQAFIRAQEESLRRVRGSVEEIAMLEAVEIARLEAEYDKALDENTALKKDLRLAEHGLKICRLQIDEQEAALREGERMQDEMLDMMSDRDDKLRRQLAIAQTPSSPRSPKDGSRSSSGAAGMGSNEAEVIRMYKYV